MTETKLLVIDDDHNICDMLKMYFEKEGYAVKTENDGIVGLEAFKNYEPDLVLLDIMMPKKDGWQVCREIREISAKPVIMITAKGDVFDKVWGFDYLGDSRTVDVHIKRLREKLEGASEKWVLKTVWGVGYKFELLN